jgi:lysozyme family protein
MFDHKIKRRAIAEVITREGGYVNHPDDRGGATCWGVTETVAREHGYHGDMKEYSIDLAIAVYDAEYWQRLMLDDVASYSVDLACKLFDFGVNSGTKRSGTHFQRLLNSLNNRGEHYPDLLVDGLVGKNTIIALDGFARKRKNHGLSVLAESLNGLRIAFCVDVTENNESQECFLFGWLSRIVEL